MHERSRDKGESLAGSLLLAHPALRDPNFRRTVILMTSDGEDGSMGMVINRPLNRRLAELGGDFALGPLASVPIFSGGPVQPGQLILAAWQQRPDGFQFQLGVDPKNAGGLLADDGTRIRAYFGCAGWSAGQLRKELESSTWIVAESPPDLFARPGDKDLWRNVLIGEGDEWRLLAGEPEDPQQN